jgi:hypothetical protein
MPGNLDQYLPKTRLSFNDGSTLLVATVSCDDRIHQAVYLSFTPAGAAAPSMELELPPKSVELLIELLQERANEARFINGEKMLVYANPSPQPPHPPLPKLPRSKVKAKTAKDPKPSSRPSTS